MSTKTLMELANSMQALNLVGTNIAETKKKKKDIVKLGVNNIVGTSLIKVNADLIAGL